MRKCDASKIGKNLNQILVQYSTVQCSTVQCNTVQCSIVLYSTVLYCAVQSTNNFIESSKFPLLYFTLVFQVTIFLVIGNHNPLYSILLFSTQIYFTLLYYTLLYSTQIYFTLLYYTLLYSTQIYFTLLYSLLC